MEREELYKNTTDLLLKAYDEGGLEHGDCMACAVGNICQNTPLGQDDKSNASLWRSLFFTPVESQRQILNHPQFPAEWRQKAWDVIAQTGYTAEELAKVELAFETSLHQTEQGYTFYTSPKFKKEGQFIGLSAVLTALGEIHKANFVEDGLVRQRLQTSYEKFCPVAPENKTES